MAKVCINMPTAWPVRPDTELRLKILRKGGIRCTKHELVVNLISPYERVSYIPESWHWHQIQERNMFLAHVEAVRLKLIPSDCDYVVFCDDDSLIDIDTMVDECSQKNSHSEAKIWESFPRYTFFQPGCPFSVDRCREFRKTCLDMAGIPRNKSEKAWSFGATCAVINQEFLRRLYGDARLAEAMKAATIKHNMPGPDIQIPYLKHMVGATSEFSESWGTTQFPIFYEYSGIVKNGRFWHIHFSIGHGLIDSQVGLIDLVKKGPKDSIRDVLPRLHHDVHKISDNSSFCFDDFLDRPLKYGGFFCWWEGYGRNISQHHYWFISLVMSKDGSVYKADNMKSPIGSWKRTELGISLHECRVASMGRRVHFDTYSGGKILGHLEKDGNKMNDTSLVVFLER